MAKLVSGIKKASKPVRNPKEPDSDKRQRLKPPPKAHATELDPSEYPEDRSGSDYISMVVTGSTGKKYNVVIPRGYYSSIPRTWEWTPVRYKVADMIALGIPYTQIVADPEVGIKSRMSIYGWMEHPEFREHVDGLILETGFASKRERIAGLASLTRMFFDKLKNELGGVKLTDKSIGAVSTALLQGMKQLAQEKEEFVESSKIEQKTTLNGTVGVATTSVEDVLNSMTDDARKQLERELAEVGDEIIRGITGEKE